jgi:Tfp pilus assembly protein PilO
VNGAPLWRRWLLPAVLLLSAVNAVAFLGWTLPHLYRQRHAQARAEASRREAAQLRQAVGVLRARAQAIRANGSDYQSFYERVAGTEKADLLPTLEAIEQMARAPGLKPKKRSFKRAEVKGTTLERVAISLPLEGSYGQLVGFLRAVERSPRFLTIDRVGMRADEKTGASLTVELSAYLRGGETVKKGAARVR